MNKTCPFHKSLATLLFLAFPGCSQLWTHRERMPTDPLPGWRDDFTSTEACQFLMDNSFFNPEDWGLDYDDPKFKEKHTALKKQFERLRANTVCAFYRDAITRIYAGTNWFTGHWDFGVANETPPAPLPVVAAVEQDAELPNLFVLSFDIETNSPSPIATCARKALPSITGRILRQVSRHFRVGGFGAFENRACHLQKINGVFVDNAGQPLDAPSLADYRAFAKRLWDENVYSDYSRELSDYLPENRWDPHLVLKRQIPTSDEIRGDAHAQSTNALAKLPPPPLEGRDLTVWRESVGASLEEEFAFSLTPDYVADTSVIDESLKTEHGRKPDDADNAFVEDETRKWYLSAIPAITRRFEGTNMVVRRERATREGIIPEANVSVISVKSGFFPNVLEVRLTFACNPAVTRPENAPWAFEEIQKVFYKFIGTLQGIDTSRLPFEICYTVNGFRYGPVEYITTWTDPTPKMLAGWLMASRHRWTSGIVNANLKASKWHGYNQLAFLREF